MKKTLITILATVLICCCVAGGTLAWLMDSTKTITNTFTVGNVDIELTETDVVTDADGNMSKEFKMVPGNKFKKDPTVTVKAGSEACWVFVEVEAINAADFLNYSVDTSKWKSLDNHDGVYYLEQAALTADGATDATYAVLATLTGDTEGNTVMVKDGVTKSMMDGLNVAGATLPTLSFTAYAVQKENLTVEAAWAEAQNAAN